MPRKPAAKLPTVNMIRDDQIAALGKHAVTDGAVIALVVYETADGRIAVRSHDQTASTTKGLLIHACEAAGLFS